MMRPILWSLVTATASMPLAAQDIRTTLTADPDARRFVIAIGPMDLPVAEHDGGGHHGEHAMVFPPVNEIAFPFDAYLYGFGYELVDADGTPLPSDLLHHLNVIDPYHRDLFLPISYRIAAVGSETGAMALPRYLFGQPVQAGQRIVVPAMLHNPTGTSYEDVTLRFYFDYVPAGRPWPLFDVYSFQMDVAFPAGDKDFDLPPGITSKSWEGRPAVEGRIVAVGGHLHPYAVSLTLDDATTGERLWTGEPVLDEQGRLVGVTVGHLYRRLGVKIYPTHRYRVTVTYDNPTGDTIPEGGMGVIGGLFIPAVRAWPAVDPSDPLYALDRKHYLREVQGTLAEITGDGDVVASDDHSAHSH